MRRLYGRLLDTLLATWGIAILIQQAIRLEFGLSFFGIHIEGLGPGLQNVAIPPFLQQCFDDRQLHRSAATGPSSSW